MKLEVCGFGDYMVQCMYINITIPILDITFEENESLFGIVNVISGKHHN